LLIKFVGNEKKIIDQSRKIVFLTLVDVRALSLLNLDDGVKGRFILRNYHKKDGGTRYLLHKMKYFDFQ
jgi:hypothetical protein